MGKYTRYDSKKEAIKKNKQIGRQPVEGF